MSLSDGALAYEWFSETAEPGFGKEESTPAIRVDPLRHGRQSGPSQVLELHWASGTCGFVSGSSPDAVGSNVLYMRIGGGCDQIFSWFTSYSPSTRKWRISQPSAGAAVALAQDRGTTYWIRDLPASQRAPLPFEDIDCSPGASVCSPNPEFADTCNPTDGTCTLMQTSDLSL
ncbi:MAG TPA: hypothetical protein VGX51_04245, partial [Solirubrobacteraceae bacterium]|nr:hypothetical protein [Solirubrobacteraceae bacterium]